MRASQAQVEALIAREKARGIPASRIILAGFSQGCAMTFKRLAPRGTAGRLMCRPAICRWPTNSGRAHAGSLRRRSSCTRHGHPVVPIGRAQQSRDLLTGMGYKVEWHEYMMQHSLCQEEIDAIGAWLKKVLA